MKKNSEFMSSCEKLKSSAKKLQKKKPKTRLGEKMTKITTYFETAPLNLDFSSSNSRLNDAKVTPILSEKEIVKSAENVKICESNSQNLTSAKNLTKIGQNLTILDHFSQPTGPQGQISQCTNSILNVGHMTVRSVLPLVCLPNPTPAKSSGVAEVTKFFDDLSSNGKIDDKLKCQTPTINSLRENDRKILYRSPGKRKLNCKENEDSKRKKVGQHDYGSKNSRSKTGFGT